MNKNLIKNEHIEMWFEEGVLFSRFPQKLELDIEKMKQLIKLREEISVGQNQYWVYDLANLKNVTKEARDYANENGQNYINAVAVVVNSHITKFIFSAYIKLKKPIMPFQVFADREKALKWLLEIKEKNNES